MMLWQKECNLNNGENVIPLEMSHFPNGIYIVKIQTDKNKMMLKVKK